MGPQRLSEEAECLTAPDIDASRHGAANLHTRLRRRGSGIPYFFLPEQFKTLQRTAVHPKRVRSLADTGGYAVGSAAHADGPALARSYLRNSTTARAQPPRTRAGSVGKRSPSHA